MEKRTLEEACEYCGVSRELIFEFIAQEWIIPSEEADLLLDAEDLARIHLIHELRYDFGVNDESMPIILHLLDQLNRMHLEIEKLRIH